MSALRYLAARTRLGVKFGLQTMAALCEDLRHPERSAPSLLVAGTNGKGSVVAYLDAALRAGGLRVGRYTSPHLVRVHERIAVDGRDVDAAGLERCVGEVREAAARLLRAGRIPAAPTYFEVLTAAAFVHFRSSRVGAMVLEVGLGGRLDATNVADPLASAIVSIDFDHQQYLGETLGAIAREKAGVLRPGRPCVLGDLPGEARQSIAEQAVVTGATLVESHDVVLEEGVDGLVARIAGQAYRGLRALPGRHQRGNLAVALRLLEQAHRGGLPVDLPAAVAGLSRACWPGRLQWIPSVPPLLVDGAHNPAGARVLAEELRDRGPFVLVFGAMQDKAIEEVGGLLLPLAREVVLTSPRLSRAASPDDIAGRLGSLAARAHRQASVPRALDLARRLCSPGAFVAVAGSLFLVGETLALVERRHHRWPAPGAPGTQY